MVDVARSLEFLTAIVRGIRYSAEQISSTLLTAHLICGVVMVSLLLKIETNSILEVQL